MAPAAAPPTVPITGKATVPALAPVAAPIPAPVPNAVAPATRESVFVAIEVNELKTNSGTTVKPDFKRPRTTPIKDLSFSSYIFIYSCISFDAP